MLIIDYDIRGIFKKDLTFDIIYDVVKKFFRKIKNTKPLLGIDNNNNNYIIKKFLEQNFSFDFLGIIPTPLLYYQVIKRKVPGIMITASHLPLKYSGLKFLLEDGSSWKPKVKLSIVKQKSVAPNLKFKDKNNNLDSKFINHKIYEEYFNRIKEIVKPKKKIFVNFDKKNFFLQISLPYFEKLKIFHRSNSPIKITSDLDNDRIFVYYKNKLILPDLIFYRLALDEKYKKLGIPIHFSQYLKKELLKLNKKFFLVKTGHYYFKKAFEKYRLDLAFEPSGHFYLFKDLKTESPYLALALFLQNQEDYESLISFNKKLTRFDVSFDKHRQFYLEKLVSFLKKKFGLKLKRFDGYFLWKEDFYLYVRKSRTENKLRISFEGDQKFLREIKNAARTFN